MDLSWEFLALYLKGLQYISVGGAGEDFRKTIHLQYIGTRKNRHIFHTVWEMVLARPNQKVSTKP